MGTPGSIALRVGFQAATISAVGGDDESQAPGEEGSLARGTRNRNKSMLIAGKEAAATGPLTPISHRAEFVLGSVGVDRERKACSPLEKASGPEISRW